MEKVPKFTVCWWWVATPLYIKSIQILHIPYIVTVYLNIDGWEVGA